MRVSFEESPFSNLLVGWMQGIFTHEGNPDFYCTDSYLSIEGNTIRWSFPETPYNYLREVSEFTLAPTTLVRFGEGNYKCGNVILSEPKEGDSYGFEKAININAPYIEGFPLVFECRITTRKEEKYHSPISSKYNDIKYDLSAEIVNVNVDDLAVEDGEICLAKALGIKWTISKDNNS